MSGVELPYVVSVESSITSKPVNCDHWTLVESSGDCGASSGDLWSPVETGRDNWTLVESSGDC